MFCRILAVILLSTLCTVRAGATEQSENLLKLNLRRQASSTSPTNQWHTVYTNATWKSRHTAVVICDMWDKHWCRGATERVAEMAPRMNQVISELRSRGVLIIHCPSSTMNFYENTPGRILAKSAPASGTGADLQAWCVLDPAQEPPLPIDDSDGGCDDEPRCKEGSPWRRQIATLEVKDIDAITDSAEAVNLMRQRGITNVIIMGVHQNMCVLGRPFGIRQLARQGLNVVLMRDLTDSMYNSRRRPFVDHFTGNRLVTAHIEKYWCPTITSEQILGGQSFHFRADNK